MVAVHHESTWFTGHVQGVGFRYTTLQVAKGYDVCGHVSNLADGRVLIEAQGKREEVHAFIRAVEERLHGYIRSTESKVHADSGSFAGFTIQ